MRELTNWRAERVEQHDDNTGFTWEVHADGYDSRGTKMDILIGDWLTQPVAHLVAAAPTMLAALRMVQGIDIHPEVLAVVDAAVRLAKPVQPVTEG